MKQLMVLLSVVAFVVMVVGGIFGAAFNHTGVVGPPLVDGTILGLQPGSTLYLMNNALLSKVGYYVLENPAWPGANFWVGRVANDGVGFVLTGANAEAINNIAKCGGNIANCRTAVDLVRWANTNGWSVISPAAVSSTVRMAIHSAIAARVASATLSETAFVFVPGAALEYADPMKVLEGYSAWNNNINEWH